MSPLATPRDGGNVACRRMPTADSSSANAHSAPAAM